MLLQASGGFWALWRLLEARGGFWRLVASGGFWKLVEASGGLWRFLEARGGFWALPGPSGGFWKPLEAEIKQGLQSRLLSVPLPCAPHVCSQGLGSLTARSSTWTCPGARGCSAGACPRPRRLVPAPRCP